MCERVCVCVCPRVSVVFDGMYENQWGPADVVRFCAILLFSRSHPAHVVTVPSFCPILSVLV